MAASNDYNYACQKCPRTFKLEDFYAKHQKVHQLKKQHVCRVCGFVYGAAKGLEGHMESAHGIRESQPSKPGPPPSQPSLPPVNTNPTVTQTGKPMQELPFGLGFHFLQRQGVMAAAVDQARLAQESASLLQKAHQAMLAGMKARTGLSLVPLTISASSSPSPPHSSSSPRSTKDDKAKIPSPAGTGNYKIYDEVPEIHDAGDAQQNDSGFFRCTICTREFSGLNSLKKHVPIHTRRVQHKCDTCGYVFGKKEYLLDHMRKHTGEISPVCEVCGQTFNKSLKLKEHQKLHRNTKNDGTVCDDIPYRCHICKECFMQPEPLGDHLRSQHSETVYKCDMCDATFGDVRGKNHHMYNEHQLDAFHQKCVWCPVCNQGFTRHYNLKVHMYKSHGKEYLENNFSAEELDSLMRPPPGSNTSKPSPSPRKVDKEENPIHGTPTGVLPISPPLTPKLSPKQKSSSGENSPSSVNGGAIHEIPRCRPGPASLTKPQHYFDQEAQYAMLKCQLCEDKFLRKSDLYIHLKEHGVTVLDCDLCEDRFLEESDLKHHLSIVHGQSYQMKEGEVKPRRRPGPASRTNPPKENRANPMAVTTNVPSHLQGHCADNHGYPCSQCGKVLMHKQSYVSHMRVIHGDYYGGNKWKGSSVVEMVLGDQDANLTRREDVKSQVTTALNNITNHPEENGPVYSDYKAFNDQNALDEHIQSKHHFLTKRTQAFKQALGLKDSDEPDSKRLKLDYEEVHKKQTDAGFQSNRSIVGNNNNNNNLSEPVEVETQTQPLSLVMPSVLTPPSDNDKSPEHHTDREPPSHLQDPEDEDVEVDVEDDTDDPMAHHQIKDRDDEIRYEPITEEFLFEGEMIRPSYCVLPFVTDEEVEKITRRNISEYYELEEEYSDEGEMVIDENPSPVPEDRPESPMNLSERKEVPAPVPLSIQIQAPAVVPMQAQPPPPIITNTNYNNNEIKINKFGHGFANSINICRKHEEEESPIHRQAKEEASQPFFYPAFPDFSLPFSLSTLLQKKKEMAAILVPRLPQTNHTKLTLEHLSKAAMSMKSSISPAGKSEGGNNTAVSEYEHQIQNDMWPIDCIKCTAVLPNLENFNIHMNDHWSEDKCCPVCGLLINSKRFNFKQHLKIHTGEKPFVCQVCNRAFRQKAHMVKHVTTHRSEPRATAGHELPFQSGVIVQ